MSETLTKNDKYKFGEFTLDTERGALLRQGEEIKLRPQSYHVLRILVERHGRLVSKEELRDEVWGRKVVTDDSLTHCLFDIRKALGDTDKSAIRTVPRRGYIFELPCIVEGPRSADGSLAAASWYQNNSFRVAVVVAVAFIAVLGLRLFETAPSRPILEDSVAVLPFADLSEQQDQAHLGHGLADEVLSLLSRSQALVVISRSSSFSFADRAPDIATIRESLGVEYVIEGSIRRSGDRIRITAQLIDTESNASIWSERYERSARELLAVQSEIAASVLGRISPAADLGVVAPTIRNYSANELMYLARYYEFQVRERPEVDEKTLNRAIQLYRDAVIAEPDSALMRSRLASALLYNGELNAAEIETFKALELNPDLSEVQDTLGRYLWIRGLPGAGDAWKYAIELNPSNADAFAAYGYWYWQQGHNVGVEPYFRRAIELDPVSLSRYADLGSFLGNDGKVSETVEVINAVRERFDDAASFRLIAYLYELIGQIDESIAWTIKARNLEPDNVDHVGQLSELFAQIGEFDTAQELEPGQSIHLLFRTRDYPKLVDLAEELMIEHPDDLVVRYMLAFAYNATGQFQSAIRTLKDTGLPDSVRGERKQAIDTEALVTMANAYEGAGDRRQANELAELMLSFNHVENDDWWIGAQKACMLAILRRDDEAFTHLRTVANSVRMPWYPMLKDSRCFQRFTDNQIYQSSLLNGLNQAKAVRERLPDTLQKHGVAL